jgi:hypothetical protein
VCNLYFYNPLNFLQSAPYKHLGAFYMYVCTDGTSREVVRSEVECGMLTKLLFAVFFYHQQIERRKLQQIITISISLCPPLPLQTIPPLDTETSVLLLPPPPPPLNRPSLLPPTHHQGDGTAVHI